LVWWWLWMMTVNDDCTCECCLINLSQYFGMVFPFWHEKYQILSRFARKGQVLNSSTQHINTSHHTLTHQINTSTRHALIHRHINASTHHHPSHYHHINTINNQHINTQHINPSTHQWFGRILTHHQGQFEAIFVHDLAVFVRNIPKSSGSHLIITPTSTHQHTTHTTHNTGNTHNTQHTKHTQHTQHTAHTTHVHITHTPHTTHTTHTTHATHATHTTQAASRNCVRGRTHFSDPTPPSCPSFRFGLSSLRISLSAESQDHRSIMSVDAIWKPPHTTHT